jgi:hypothetical protein
MCKQLGVARDDQVRALAREYDIDIPADKSIVRTRRINSTHGVNNTASALEGLAMGIELIKYDELDREQMPEWITSMRTAEGVLRRHRERLEATLAQSDRRCLVCDTAVTDRVYCGATCRQRARRAATLKQNAADLSLNAVPSRPPVTGVDGREK